MKYIDENDIYRAEHEAVMEIITGDDSEEFAAGKIAGVVALVCALLEKGED